MKYYASITEYKNKNEIIALFIKLGANKNKDIYLDSFNEMKKPHSYYNDLKKTLLKTKEEIYIDNFNSLGKTKREIYNELEWFYNNNIIIRVHNCPSTFKKNVKPSEIITEIYRSQANDEQLHLKVKQRFGLDNSINKSGRKKIPYPSNWEENYKKWINKELKTPEFIKKCGLKVGTFYNLLKQYKESQNEKDKSIIKKRKVC